MRNNYLKLTRVNEYLHILAFIFPLIFFISPGNLFSSITIMVFLANLFLTSFGLGNALTNDIIKITDINGKIFKSSCFKIFLCL